MSDRRLKWVILGDTHFGARNDSKIFHGVMRKFFQDVFIPYLLDNGIKTVVTLGDFFDRRKFINFETLKLSRELFFDPLKEHGIKVHMIIGNHDVYYKNTNRVNSVQLLVNEHQYSNVTVYADPQDVVIDDVKLLMLPWINQENYADTMKAIRSSDARFVVSHLELSGFEYHRGLLSDHGHCDADELARFEQVWTGHYHCRSSKGNIHYLGTPYEMNWSDYNDPKGFHFFDGVDLKFIETPIKTFVRLVYDDTSPKKVEDFIHSGQKFTDQYVKVVVRRKQKPILYERYLDVIQETGPVDLNVVDETNRVVEGEESINMPTDTLDIVSEFVNNELDTDLDKNRIIEKIQKIYVIAKNFSEDE